MFVNFHCLFSDRSFQQSKNANKERKTPSTENDRKWAKKPPSLTCAAVHIIAEGGLFIGAARQRVAGKVFARIKLNTSRTGGRQEIPRLAAGASRGGLRRTRDTAGAKGNGCARNARPILEKRPVLALQADGVAGGSAGDTVAQSKRGAVGARLRRV